MMISFMSPMQAEELQGEVKSTIKITALSLAYVYKIPSKAVHFGLSEEMTKVTVKIANKTPYIKNRPKLIKVVGLSTGVAYWAIWDICIQRSLDPMALAYDVTGSGVAIDWSSSKLTKENKEYIKSEIHKAMIRNYSEQRAELISGAVQ